MLGISLSKTYLLKIQGFPCRVAPQMRVNEDSIVGGGDVWGNTNLQGPSEQSGGCSFRKSLWGQCLQPRRFALGPGRPGQTEIQTKGTPNTQHSIIAPAWNLRKGVA